MIVLLLLLFFNIIVFVYNIITIIIIAIIIISIITYYRGALCHNITQYVKHRERSSSYIQPIANIGNEFSTNGFIAIFDT